MKNLILSALLMGAATFSFAESPKEAKDSPTSTETTTGVVKWFHFNGSNSNPSDLTDPSKYTPEDAPTCSSQTEENRCDIKIMSQSTNQDLPDLSQSVLDERTRTED